MRLLRGSWPGSINTSVTLPCSRVNFAEMIRLRPRSISKLPGSTTTRSCRANGSPPDPGNCIAANTNTTSATA